MNVNKLLKALDDESNENLFHFTSKKMKDLKISILRELNLQKPQLDDYLNKLEKYKYVDEICDLKYGSYIRWISLKNPNEFKLTRGAVLCDIKITDKGILIVCKGLNHNVFQIKMDDCLLFQMLKEEENVLLNVLDHLSK